MTFCENCKKKLQPTYVGDVVGKFVPAVIFTMDYVRLVQDT